MLGSMTATAVYAHIPTSVSLGSETESAITISWTHATDDSCGSGCDGITDVDIIRTPGQIGSTLNTVHITNSTQYVVANNATGLSSWVDHSLPSGTVFMHEVCHPDPDTHTCAVADTNATNAAGVDPTFTQTKAKAINATSINFSMDQNSAVVSWAGPPSANHTAVTGLKIELKK